MGGDGQPQTQATIFTRYVLFAQTAQQAIAAPRWLLGRTWGKPSDSLKLESRFDPVVVAALKAKGHEIELLGETELRLMKRSAYLVAVGRGDGP
jgi:gamma-glutamyltranspeptidase/glutathione hydrolase